MRLANPLALVRLACGSPFQPEPFGALANTALWLADSNGLVRVTDIPSWALFRDASGSRHRSEETCDWLLQNFEARQSARDEAQGGWGPKRVESDFRFQLAPLPAESI